MTPDELSKKLSELSEDLKHDCAEIIAETATEYFKGTFKNKAFDGRPWKRTAKKTGSINMRGGTLRPWQDNTQGKPFFVHNQA